MSDDVDAVTRAARRVADVYEAGLRRALGRYYDPVLRLPFGTALATIPVSLVSGQPQFVLLGALLVVLGLFGVYRDQRRWSE